jgi:hypothetical protein
MLRMVTLTLGERMLVNSVDGTIKAMLAYHEAEVAQKRSLFHRIDG